MRLHHAALAVLGTSALLFTGCSTSTTLKIKRAPELSLPGVKVVKVKEFDLTGDLDLDLTSKGGLLGAVVGTALDAGTNALAAKKDSALQKQNLTGLKQAIVQNGYYKVTEGDDYDVLISGSAVYDVRDEGEELNDNGKTSYQIKRKSTAQLKFNVLDKAGSILAASDATGVQVSTSTASSHTEARSNVQSWQTLVRKSFEDANSALVKKIAPYYVQESRTFETGDDSNIKDANKSARSGAWDAAVMTWKATQNGSPKDKVASLHNLAIYDEYEGNVEEALAKYQQVQTLAPTSSHAVDVARTQGRLAEIQKLKDADASRAAKPTATPATTTPVAAPAKANAPTSINK